VQFSNLMLLLQVCRRRRVAPAMASSLGRGFLQTWARRISGKSRAEERDGAKIGHVVVIGGGAVGSLFAARLSTLKDLSGRVWLLTGWKEHGETIMQTKGLILKESPSIGGACLVGGVRIAQGRSQIFQDSRADEENATGQINVVILAVKQSQIRRASVDAADLLSKSHGGILISLLNGVGHMDILRQALACLPIPTPQKHRNNRTSPHHSPSLHPNGLTNPTCPHSTCHLSFSECSRANVCVTLLHVSPSHRTSSLYTAEMMKSETLNP
jgi:hypothetical protein